MKKVLLCILLLCTYTAAISQNPILLKDVYPGITGSGIQQIVKTSNYIFFNAEDDDADTDRGLYRTDGSTSGTVQLNLTYPGYASTKADKLTALGNKIIFAGNNFPNNGEIWASDGTQAGTVALERLQPNSNRIPVVEINAMGSYAYYSIINKDESNVNHAYLKRTDGTAAGTSLVYDFSAFTGVPQVVFLTPVNNILYFIVYDQFGTGFDQLWRSDGTTAGTYMVYNFGPNQYVASYLMVAGDNMYVMIVTPGTGNVLWKSDGTAAGTVPVKTIAASGNNNYPPFAAIGSTLYFAGLDGNGKELWKTDGTNGGTILVSDINAGAANSNPASMVVFNNTLYFSATTAAEGNELWKFDGTTASLVKDIYPGTSSGNPFGFVISNNTMLFRATGDIAGPELWITDGTSINTRLVKDINPTGSSAPSLLTALNNTVYFTANNGTSGQELYKFDNTDGIAGLNKIYVNDNSQTSDVFTTAIGDNANMGTRTAPVATVTHALSIAQPGDTIYIDAGNYAEQVIIDKGITIIGAGQNLTLITNPASPLLPPPGPFTEYALIQTAQNIGDVHISNLQTTNNPVNDGHSILLQTGGSVKNCRIIDGSLGVYVRVESATTNVVVENNFIQSSVFAVACQGSGVTATILNNTLNLFNPGFSVGIWVGVDFGPIVKLTATGNSINNYVYRGIVGNSNNTVLTENSILGTGQYAIENTAAPAMATCNWYGSSDQYVVASKISGAVNFSPWLANGTDNDLSSIGFQPVPGSCAGRQLFYVNDNSLTGDVFTTAVGNNANNGSPSAPLATITAALVKAQPGDFILVDAGSYTEIVNITKNVSILGAGKGVTILNGPAGPVTPFPNTGETGIIQTLNGLTDVIIESLTVDGTNSDEQHGIFIQGGGRVSNCELRYVNDGFYFQYLSAEARTAIGNNNYVHHINYVGALFAGNGLSATASNNVIDLTGALFGMGFISGYGGSGNVASFTASNNSIINFNGFGMTIGSIQPAQINNNSITRITGNYISNAHSVSIDATCNWFGTSDAAIIIPNITGAVSYSQWLSNGTDNDPAFGFQPQPNVCNGRQNKFYVNDADITGDMFTTAVGNNANSGIPSAPLLTINAAIAKASAGDTIIVDAGMFIENVIVNKQVVLQGVKFGQNPNALLDRGSETIVIPAVTNLNLTGGSVIRVAASDVTIDGFTIDGNNTSINSGTLVNGEDVNAATGIFNDNIVVSNIIVKNTIVKNTGTYGIGLFRTFTNTTGPVVSGNLFTQNRVDNIGGRGIVFAYSAYGSITNNYITRCGNSGTWFSQINVANVNNSPGIVSGNYIEAGNTGMQSSSLGVNASAVQYQDNHIVGKSASALGLSLLIANPSGIVVSNNKFADLSTGVAANNTGNQNNMITVTITNNSFENISGSIFNIFNNTYFDARCNWYGSTAAQNFINKLPLTANLDIVPWLTNGTDNDVATGFQPVPDACDGYPTLITLNSSTNVTCNGAANGTINITTSYGKAPFTYTWTKEGDALFVSHDEDPTGLAPGTYHLSILDGNGSNIYITDPEADGPGTITVTITEPDFLTASASGSNNICFNGIIGSASVLPAGGTAPYTYLWSNGATTDEISNLAAGIYDVTVTDANGCTTTASYEVTQPTQVTASITNSSSACSNIATVAAEGGTPGYTYLWSNGSTSATISGVPVGSYDVTVTDANGCTTTASVTLTVSGAFNPSASVSNVTCFGAANGSITVTNANGAAPFMFSKDGGVSFENGSFPYSFTNLAPGTYNIAVKDANGCVGFIQRTVTQPTALTATISSVQSTCFGASTGAINVSVSGGLTAYSYSWTKDGGGFSSSQLNINGVAAGNYTLTVTDKNGCTAVLPVSVPSNNEIVVSAAITNVLCRNTATGAINLTVTGGTGSGFIYSWTGASVSTNEDLNNISAANNYNIRITDIGSGCFVDRTYSVTQPAALTLSSTGMNATDCNLGTITASAGGGAGNYQFNLNAGAYQLSNVFTGLAAGTYTVGVRDGNGCITTVQRTITDNGSDAYESNNSKNQAKAIVVGTTINARLALSNDAADWFTFTAPGSTTGLYSIKITHPTATYTVNVYPSGKNTAALVPVSVITNGERHYQLTAGATYFVSITTTTLSYVCYNLTVSALEPIEVTSNRTENRIEAAPTVEILKAFTYPNPHNGSFTMSIESPEEGVATVELYTVNGQKLSERKANVVKGKGNTVKYSNMKYAILFYKVRIGKHVVTGKIISPN